MQVVHDVFRMDPQQRLHPLDLLFVIFQRGGVLQIAHVRGEKNFVVTGQRKDILQIAATGKQRRMRLC